MMRTMLRKTGEKLVRSTATTRHQRDTARVADVRTRVGLMLLNLRVVIADINIVIMVYDDRPVGVARGVALTTALATTSPFGVNKTNQHDDCCRVTKHGWMHVAIWSVMVRSS